MLLISLNVGKMHTMHKYLITKDHWDANAPLSLLSHEQQVKIKNRPNAQELG